MVKYIGLFVSADDLDDSFVQRFILNKRREIKKIINENELVIQRVREDWIVTEHSELASLEKEIISRIERCNGSPSKPNEINEARCNIALREAKLKAVEQQEILLNRLSVEYKRLEILQTFLYELSDDITVTSIKRNIEDIREQCARAKEDWVVKENEALVKLEEDVTELHNDISTRREIVEVIKKLETDVDVFLALPIELPKPLDQLYCKLVLWDDLDRELQIAMDEDRGLIHEEFDEGAHVP